jgi:SIR2-like domain
LSVEWLDNIANRSHIKRLRRALSEDNAGVIIFLGAGLSFGASRSRGRYDLDKWKHEDDLEPFPSWDDLVRRMLAQLKQLAEFAGREDELEEFFDQQDALDCAELFANSVGKANFTQFLRDQFLVPHPYITPSHEALAELPVPELFTTNYDELIEEAFHRTITVSAGPEQFISRLSLTPERHLVKLHGTISEPSTIVLTRSQYAKSRRERIEMFSHLGARMRKLPFIFVGYSLSDPNFVMIRDEARLAMGANMPPSYLVQGRSNKVRESYLRALDVNVISLGTWNYLPSFLRSINPKVSFPPQSEF